jgi:transcriptional regulator of acetoin/glycerol metabolism
VRELEAILWRAMTSSTGSVIGLTSEVEELLDVPDAPPGEPLDTTEPGPDALRAALDAHGGNVTRAARSLGLPSRYALYRLMKKHDID